MKDLRTENDNLKIWRKTKAKLTEQLLKKSLNELIKIKATINHKIVCEMMQKLASREDIKYNAMISPSAISKNKVYKSMIAEAKEKVQLSDNSKKSYNLDADKKLEVFQLKTIIAKKEAKIKELESIIKRADISYENNINVNDSLDKSINYKEIINEMISFIRNEGVAFIDSNGDLISEDGQNILISCKTIKSIFE